MFYYLDPDRHPHGPHSREELAQLLDDGTLSASTLVAAKGDAHWVALDAFLHPEPPHAANELSFWGTLERAFAGYATAKGRATRKEYWCFMLIFGVSWLILALTFVALLVSSFALSALAVNTDEFKSAVAAVILLCITAGAALLLLLMAPGLVTLQIRRFHDSGLSGWWAAVPIVLEALSLFLPSVDALFTHADAISAIFLRLRDILSGVAETTTLPKVTGSGEGFSIPDEFYTVLLVHSEIFFLVMLILSLRDSQRGTNKYGPSLKYPDSP